MAHRNRWFTVLNSMVIFHGELLVITRGSPVSWPHISWTQAAGRSVARMALRKSREKEVTTTYHIYICIYSYIYLYIYMLWVFVQTIDVWKNKDLSRLCQCPWGQTCGCVWTRWNIHIRNVPWKHQASMIANGRQRTKKNTFCCTRNSWAHASTNTWRWPSMIIPAQIHVGL